MLIVNINEMRHNLDQIMIQIEAGERIVVTDEGKPIAEIRPVATAKTPRPFGLCAGEFVVPDDFDAPLPEDILSAFEGQ